MKKVRRLLRQDNRGKVGKKIKGKFRDIQEELVQEKIKEAKKKREDDLKGNRYNGVSPDVVDGLPGSIPYNSGLPAVEGMEDTLPQRIADDAFDGVAQAKEENYGEFRTDIKETMKSTASMLKEMIIDFQKEVVSLILKKNDPKWADLGIEKKARIFSSVTESLQKINNVELSWAKPDSKKGGGQTQINIYHGIPEDPVERARQLVELDAILGRQIIPAPGPGQQQRILIETKPMEGDNSELLKIGSGKQDSEKNVE